MEEKCPVINTDIKTIEIKEGENKYKCQLQTIKDFLQISLFIGDDLKYEGNIHLSKIQNQIYAFMDYNINEFFEEINLLNPESFSIIKDDNKYKLNIEFTILRRKKYIYIDLIEKENMVLENKDLIETIFELKEIIKIKD